MKKHLLIFAAFYTPFTSAGYAQNIWHLARRLVRQGWRVTVFTTKTHGGEAFAEEDGVLVIRVPVWNVLGTYPIFKPTTFFFRMIWSLLRDKIDVVSTQTRFFQTSIFGLIFALLKRIPFIHTERGSVHTDIANPIIRAINVLVDHSCGAAIVLCARMNVGVSAAAAEFCKHLGAKRTIVIPNGIDMSAYALPRKSNGKIKIIFIGRLIWAKGIHDLIEAISLLPSNVRERICVSIIGDGSYQATLKDMVRQKELSSCTLLCGKAPRNEIPALLSQADIFVNPSYSEGLPTTVLEAAASGAAIIATDVGGTREIIDDGISGLVIPPKKPEILRDALLRLINDPQLRRKIGTSAKEQVQKKFDWELVTQQYHSLFKRVIL